MLPIIYFTSIAAILFLALRMTCGACVMGANTGAGRPGLPLMPLGWALSLFLAVTFVVCVVFDLIFPDYAMYETWAGLLPGFVWLTPVSLMAALTRSRLPSYLISSAKLYAKESP